MAKALAATTAILVIMTCATTMGSATRYTSVTYTGAPVRTRALIVTLVVLHSVPAVRLNDESLSLSPDDSTDILCLP